MKVVHITTVHGPFDTRIFEKMCKSAVRAGHDVTLIAPHDQDETVDGVKILGIPKRQHRLARALFCVRDAIRIANQGSADIYHIHDPELLFGIRFLSGKGIVIYDMHENMAASLQHKAWITPALRAAASRVWARIERVLLKDVPVIFAEHSYRRAYPWVRRSEVVLNMPKTDELAAYHSGSKLGSKIVYVGGVNAGRGSLVTLRALEILKHENIRVQFLCIGPASEEHRTELEAFAHRASLSDIEFPGRLRAAEAWRAASTGQIGLATLLPLPNYMESYPTKLFEYMAIGLPVIASNFPLYREIVESNGCGICVDPENPKEVADAIKTLLKNPSLAAEMGNRGQRAALERYRWDIEAEKLNKFYARILAERSRELARGACT